MNQTAKRITDFRVSWDANHEQYYQGHSTTFTGYLRSGQGCAETLREAFEDALDDLIDNGAADIDKELVYRDAPFYTDLLVELISQVKDPEMLDWDIVRAECPEQGKHCTEDSEEYANGGQLAEDCAICAGEWHFYVNVDVRVE